MHVPELPQLPENWQRCRAFMTKKKRYCRQIPIKGSMFCGNHVDYVSVCQPAPEGEDKSSSCNRSRTKRPRIGLPLFSVGLNDTVCDVVVKDETIQSSKKKERGKRIPCPIDPSHTIYESNLKAHLKKCNKLTQRKSEEAKAFFRNGINLGGFGGLGCKIIEDKNKGKDSTYYQHLAIRILNAYETVFGSAANHLSSPSEIDHFNSKGSSASGNDHICCDATTISVNRPLHERNNIINLTHEHLYSKISHENLFQKEQCLGLEQSLVNHRVKIGGLKHLEQVGSIVGHVRKMIQPKNKEKDKSDSRITNILEMGAGRATTGFVVASVVASMNNDTLVSNEEETQNDKKVKLILVERSGSRGKADRAIQREKRNDNRTSSDDPKSKSMDDAKKEYMDVNAVDIQRIKCDLANVYLPTVLSMNEEDVVYDSKEDGDCGCRDTLVIAKHCCGAGTDLALKSIVPIKKRIYGCIFTTCCHGVCSWENYVGRDYLVEIFNNLNESNAEGSHFGAEEFDLMRRWASGTVIGEAGVRKATDSSNQDVTNAKIVEANQDTQPEHQKYIEYDKGDNPKNITNVVKSLQLKCGLEGLGRACQRLIDFGRCQFMKDHLFDEEEGKKISLSHYVDSNVTPQNALLCGQCK